MRFSTNWINPLNAFCGMLALLISLIAQFGNNHAGKNYISSFTSVSPLLVKSRPDKRQKMDLANYHTG